MRIQRVIVLTAAVAFLVLPAIRSTAQKNPGRSPDADWPMFNRDYAGTRFSPLTQINTSNVTNLKQAWTYKLRPHDGKLLTGLSAGGNFSGDHADRCERSDVSAGGQSGRCTRTGDR